MQKTFLLSFTDRSEKEQNVNFSDVKMVIFRDRYLSNESKIRKTTKQYNNKKLSICLNKYKMK